MTAARRPAEGLGEPARDRGEPRALQFGADHFTLARFPVAWNHAADKKSRQINGLAHVLAGDVASLRWHMRWRIFRPDGNHQADTNMRQHMNLARFPIDQAITPDRKAR